MTNRWTALLVFAILGLTLLAPGPAAAAEPIRIGVLQGVTGPFEVYAKQMITGFKLGLEYGTGGKNELLGRKLEVLVEDDQLKPDVSKRLITKLYADDKVDLVVGTTSSAAPPRARTRARPRSPSPSRVSRSPRSRRTTPSGGTAWPPTRPPSRRRARRWSTRSTRPCRPRTSRRRSSGSSGRSRTSPRTRA